MDTIEKIETDIAGIKTKRVNVKGAIITTNNANSNQY